jgi:hypothetical protein
MIKQTIIKTFLITALTFLCQGSICFAQAQAPAKKISVSGSNILSGQWMDPKNPYSTVPAFYVRDEFNMKISLYGLPFYTGFLLTTENKPFKQQMNQFYFRFAADEWIAGKAGDLSDSLKKKSGFMNILLSRFYRLEAGTCYPDYSKIAFGGVPVKGINIAFMPGPVFMAFSYGNMNRETKDAPAFENPYQRKMIYGSLGFGKPQKTHLFFNFMHIYDLESSAVADTFTFIRPGDTIVFGGDTIIHNVNESEMTQARKENFIAGSDFQLSFLKNRITFGGEVSLSLLTPDRSAAKIDIEEAPSWAMDYFDPRLGSHVDFSYLVKSDINLKTTSIRSSFKQISPGYESLANPYLRADSKELNFLLKQHLLERKITFQLSFINRDDHNRGSFQSLGFSTFIHMGKWPTVMIGLYPSRQKSTSYSYNNSLYQLSLNYPWKIKTKNLNTSISLSNQTGIYETEQQSNPLHYWNVSFNQLISFKKSMSVSLFSNMSLNRMTEVQKSLFTLGGNFSTVAFHTLRSVIGISFIQDQDKNYTVKSFLSCGINVGKIGTFDLKVQHHMYSFYNEGQNDRSEWMCNFSITIRF